MDNLIKDNRILLPQREKLYRELQLRIQSMHPTINSENPHEIMEHKEYKKIVTSDPVLRAIDQKLKLNSSFLGNINKVHNSVREKTKEFGQKLKAKVKAKRNNELLETKVVRQKAKMKALYDARPKKTKPNLKAIAESLGNVGRSI